MPQNYFKNLPIQGGQVPQGPYAPQQAEILRRQKLAQMLQQQAMQPIEAPQTPQGGFAAPISPLQVAEKLFQGYAGKKQNQQVATQQQQLAEQMQTERQQALARALQQAGGSPQPAPEMGGGPAMPPDPMGAAGTLAGSQDPMLQQAGMGMIGQQFKNQMPQQPQPFTLSPGAVRYGPDGKPIATAPQAPKAPEPFTLAPGGTRYDPQGKLIVTSPQSPTPQVAIDMKGESEYVKKVSGLAGERDIGQHDSAQAAVENLNKLNLTLQHIKQSGAITGMGSEVLKNVERAKAVFMADKAAGKRASDTELLDALLGSDVFPMIKQLGIGARGLDTPAEREFLRNVMTGTTPLNRDTLVRMTEIRKDIAERSIERWNDRVEKGELNRYFRALGTEPQKVEKPKFDTQKPQTPKFTEGMTATGPNGQRIIFRNGQWQAM